MGTIKSIGILTSGGDAPGMNAAIRAVTRSAIYNGLKVYGIYRGYKGLVTDEIQEFKSQNVSNIIQMGGTIPVSYTHLSIRRQRQMCIRDSPKDVHKHTRT